MYCKGIRPVNVLEYFVVLFWRRFRAAPCATIAKPVLHVHHLALPLSDGATSTFRFLGNLNSNRCGSGDAVAISLRTDTQTDNHLSNIDQTTQRSSPHKNAKSGPKCNQSTVTDDAVSASVCLSPASESLRSVVSAMFCCVAACRVLSCTDASFCLYSSVVSLCLFQWHNFSKR